MKNARDVRLGSDLVGRNKAPGIAAAETGLACQRQVSTHAKTFQARGPRCFVLRGGKPIHPFRHIPLGIPQYLILEAPT